MIHNLYSLPNNIKMIKSKLMRWAGHAALIRETKKAYRILVGKFEVKDHLEDLNVAVKIILKRI